MGNLDACLAYIMLFIIMEMWVVFFLKNGPMAIIAMED
jgi:hypothetical protein